MSDPSSFCICEHNECPRHPVNHDKGCAPCIAKNLHCGEIPNCFFNKIGASKDRPGDTYLDFANAVLKTETCENEYDKSEHLKQKYEFRSIRQEEAEQSAKIEMICFPPNEACSEEMMIKRVITAPDLFLVAEDRKSGKIAGFLNGLSTCEEKFRDEFFFDVSLYDPDGKNIMLLGLDVLPEHRGQGLASKLTRLYAERERKKGRKSLILTCLPDKVAMYKNFGFEDLGISASKWGGEEWHEMKYTLL